MSRRRTRRKKQHTAANRVLAAGGIVFVVMAIGLVSMDEAQPTPMATVVDVPEGRVRVEVLNGGDVDGMARNATARLRDVGFDVVDFGNAETVDTERPSSVIDRVGRTDMAQAVADALGIDNVQSEPDPNLYVDVSVLLGSEWRPSDAGSVSQEDVVRGWWDPRGWLRR